MPVSHEISDTSVIDFLRRHDRASITDLVDFTRVTATAVRHRLARLMKAGWVERVAEVAGRGRPQHRYSLTRKGRQSGGSNYEDLADVLWSEIRAVQDTEVRRGLLRRIVGRLTEIYRGKVEGATLRERMDGLVALMDDRNVLFEVEEKETGAQPLQSLPVLTALACPYPDLAEQDRMICALEKMLFSEMLDTKLRLTTCRLDGGNCCTFEASSEAVPIPSLRTALT